MNMDGNQRANNGFVNYIKTEVAAFMVEPKEDAEPLTTAEQEYLNDVRSLLDDNGHLLNILTPTQMNAFIRDLKTKLLID